MSVPSALDADPALLDEHEQRFVASIREHGWFRTNVFAEEGAPGFAYSTGFWLTAGAAEIIVFSLKSETAHQVLWDMFRDSQSGRNWPVGRPLDGIFGNLPAFLFPVWRDQYREHLGWSRWFYGSETFPCLQLVWPDRAGLFPWQAGFDSALAPLQPDITETDWVQYLA